jgi:hypothetical protein
MVRELSSRDLMPRLPDQEIRNTVHVSRCTVVSTPNEHGCLDSRGWKCIGTFDCI